MTSLPAVALAEMRRPTEWSKRDAWIASVLFLLSILYLWPFRSAFTFPNPDEGIVLQGAVRVLQGQLPYRPDLTIGMRFS